MFSWVLKNIRVAHYIILKKLYYKGFLSKILNNHYNNPVRECYNGYISTHYNILKL